MRPLRAGTNSQLGLTDGRRKLPISRGGQAIAQAGTGALALSTSILIHTEERKSADPFRPAFHPTDNPDVPLQTIVCLFFVSFACWPVSCCGSAHLCLWYGTFSRKGETMGKYVLLLLGLAICAGAQAFEDDLIGGQWRMAGHDFSNSRNQPAEVRIGPLNVHSLAVKWVFTTGGDISATPTVYGNAVFFPDWAGNLFAVNKHTGQLIWSHQIGDYDGFSPNARARTSPAIHGGDLIIGDIERRFRVFFCVFFFVFVRGFGVLFWF